MKYIIIYANIGAAKKIDNNNGKGYTLQEANAKARAYAKAYDKVMVDMEG